MKQLSDSATAAISLWMNSTAIARKIDLGLGAIHGIAFSEYIVLLHLVSAPGRTLRRIDLADAMGRTASGVTRMLRPMEKIGLVKKERNPRDARVSLVKITAAGEEIFADATTSLNQSSKDLLKRLDKDGLKNLLEIMNILSEK
jgi:DNA-binding MarR family transcriptional regulator